MNLLDHAKNIVCGIIAVALAMLVATVEALLPSRPDWLERVQDLALRLKYRPSGAESGTPGPEKAETPSGPEMDADRLLLAYNQLWQFAHGIRSKGLALDDKFCEQIEREWTVTKLLSYLKNADRSLQDRAENSLESASTFLAAAASGSEKPS
ncbi:MAG: hypothetical protein O3C49_00505 [Proteobacteria bacterium]|nr:hypothetical protein [Pseudomonadota bacterium]MDA1323966.1 hypothetical protein [Pseudomonadota bacterium]